MHSVYHVRSLRRRIVAFLVDSTLLAVIFSMLIYPFANDLDGSLRLTSSLFNYTRCNDGTAFNAKGDAFSTEGWQRTLVCDTITNWAFPSRSATFVRQRQSGKTKVTEYVNFQLDSRNRVTAAWPVDSLILFLFPVVSALFEASKLRATPGKRLMNFEVHSVEGEQLTIVRAMLRNSAKYLALLVFGLTGIASALYMPHFLNSSVFMTDNRVVLPEVVQSGWAYGSLIVALIISLANLIIWASILVPWRAAGRALYDRWAGSVVD
jgi:uncharacterized RDD family membrane protein YckC